jgi:hypothetical protein
MEPQHSHITMDSNSNKLKNRWNLWSHLPHDPDWTPKSYTKVSPFATTFDVIAITESLPKELLQSCMFFVMKNGIVPMWEDPKNRNGGCFSYKVSNKAVPDVWKDITYALTGETLSVNNTFVNNVTGISISPKKNFCIVKIWMSNCEYQNPQIVTNEIKGLGHQGCLFKKHTPEFDL